MKNIFIIGTGGSGKTAFGLSLGKALQDAGKKVAYFKPVGSTLRQDSVDQDVVLMKETLGLEADLEDMVPIQCSPFYLTKYPHNKDYMPIIRAAYEKVAKDADHVIIEGTTSPRTMFALGLDAFTLAKEFDAGIIMVKRVEHDGEFDRLMLYNEYIDLKGLKRIGTVFNNIPHALLDKTKGIYQTILEEHNCEVYGVIPANVRISSPTVKEINEVLGGELLEGDTGLNNIVEDILIGAMTLESALHYLRRAANKAIVTGGDRADLLMAAIETNASVLILTGGLYPSVNVLARAHEKKIPVILVHYDTYTAIEKLHDVARKISPTDLEGIEVAHDNFNKFVEKDRLLEKIFTL